MPKVMAPNKGLVSPEKSFKSALKYYRVLSGMSKRELGEKSGNSLSYIAALEGNPAYPIPETNTIYILAQALKLNEKQTSDIQLKASIDRKKIECSLDTTCPNNLILIQIVNEWQKMSSKLKQDFQKVLEKHSQ